MAEQAIREGGGLAFGKVMQHIMVPEPCQVSDPHPGSGRVLEPCLYCTAFTADQPYALSFDLFRYILICSRYSGSSLDKFVHNPQ